MFALGAVWSHCISKAECNTELPAPTEFIHHQMLRCGRGQNIRSCPFYRGGTVLSLHLNKVLKFYSEGLCYLSEDKINMFNI